jgi:hypothetical protein
MDVLQRFQQLSHGVVPKVEQKRSSRLIWSPVNYGYRG